MQLRAVSNQCCKRISQRDCRTDGDVVGVLLHPAQFVDLAHVDDLVKLCMLLGDPQANVGGAGDQLCIGVRCSGLQQGLQGAGRIIRKISLQSSKHGDQLLHFL